MGRYRDIKFSLFLATLTESGGFSAWFFATTDYWGKFIFFAGESTPWGAGDIYITKRWLLAGILSRSHAIFVVWRTKTPLFLKEYRRNDSLFGFRNLSGIIIFSKITYFITKLSFMLLVFYINRCSHSFIYVLSVLYVLHFLVLWFGLVL